LEPNDWVKELPAEVTVCDEAGRLTEMNDAAEGGRGLLGADVLDCHTDADRRKLEVMLKEGRSNVCLNEENGTLTFVYQSPWYADGRCAGLVDISFGVPGEIPHHLRE